MLRLIKFLNKSILGLRFLHVGYVFFCNSAIPFIPSWTTKESLLLNKIAIEWVRYLEQYYYIFFSGEWFTGECGWEHSTDGPGFWSPTPPSGSGTGECLF